MKHRRRAVLLWLSFAFVTWNVVFDRGVANAALEFTREQIVRHQNGAPVVSIDAGFRPRVGHAALTASLYSGLVLACGARCCCCLGGGRKSWERRKCARPRCPGAAKPPMNPHLIYDWNKIGAAPPPSVVMLDDETLA